MKSREINKTQAHPFVIHNFISPYICEHDGEFIAIINKQQVIYLIENNSLVQDFPVTETGFQPITKVSLRTFQLPFLVCVNNTPNVVIIRNNSMQIIRLPIFLKATYCAVLSQNTVAIGDKNHIFTWYVEENKCKLLFTSSIDILYLHASNDTIFVLTKEAFHVISKDAPQSSISLQVPENAQCFASYDSTAFFIHGKQKIIPILVDNREITMRQHMTIPENCLVLTAIGRRGRELFGMFSSNQQNKSILRRVVSGSSEWSLPIDVPPLSAMCGSNSFAIAVGAQFVLVLHDIPQVFDAFSNPRTTIMDVIRENQQMTEVDLFDALVLQYGLLQVAAKLQKGESELCSRLVSLVLEELWQRKLYPQWSSLALKWPEHLNTNQSSKYIMEASKISGTPIIPFAIILEQSGDLNNSFILYLKAKVGDSVVLLLDKCDGMVVQEHITELCEMASDSLKKGQKQVAESIIRYFCTNDLLINPEKVVPSVQFDWDLLDLYYKTFERPPPCVVNAYISGLATYRPDELMKFLQNNKNYDTEKTCDLLLRLGYLDEYGYIISKKSPEKYVEFLIFRQKWDVLFDEIRQNKALAHTVLQLVPYDSEYFKEFVQRLGSIDMSLSDVLKELPQECPAQSLAEGFRILAQQTTANSEIESRAEEICHDEAYKVLQKRLDKRTKPKTIYL